MENISRESVENTQPDQQQQKLQQEQQKLHQEQQASIMNVNVVDENTALNVMVSFLHLAQKRGAFNIQESAKVWECVKLFMKQ